MGRKEIQEQRMKDYFIQATKEILKAEGIGAVSVRSIAEKAGYSFATLYNYFKDVKDLVFFCVKDFQKECEDYIESKMGKAGRGEAKIKAIALAYVEYFVQYPGVFELFFIEKMSAIGSNKASADSIVSFLDHLCKDELKYCIDEGIYTRKEAEALMAELKALTTGALVIYLNRNYPETHGDFIKRINQQLDRITKRA
jgi:AcrR family transcriptional regulator